MISWIIELCSLLILILISIAGWSSLFSNPLFYYFLFINLYIAKDIAQRFALGYLYYTKILLFFIPAIIFGFILLIFYRQPNRSASTLSFIIYFLIGSMLYFNNFESYCNWVFISFYYWFIFLVSSLFISSIAIHWISAMILAGSSSCFNVEWRCVIIVMTYSAFPLQGPILRIFLHCALEYYFSMNVIICIMHWTYNWINCWT